MSSPAIIEQQYQDPWEVEDEKLLQLCIEHEPSSFCDRWFSSNKQEEVNSLQSGTITQGSQATTGSKSKKGAFKRFMSNFNCMSGVYGMVRKDQENQAASQAHVERL